MTVRLSLQMQQILVHHSFYMGNKVTVGSGVITIASLLVHRSDLLPPQFVHQELTKLPKTFDETVLVVPLLSQRL